DSHGIPALHLLAALALRGNPKKLAVPVLHLHSLSVSYVQHSVSVTDNPTRKDETMNAVNLQELTFGIEIETTIPASSPVNVGHPGQAAAVPQLRGEWKADRDPSIRCRSGQKQCEFVSPVFKGTEGLKQLVADVATIKSLGATVNESCGLHIHVGF